MAKIYTPPVELLPEPHPGYPYDPEAYQKEENEWLAKLKAWLKNRNPTGQLVGEEIAFSVADGSARYLIANLRPIELIHLPLLDGYNFPMAHRLTVTDIKRQLEFQKATDALFSRAG